MMQVNLFKRQKEIHRHREGTHGCQGEGRKGKEGLGVWD